MLKTERIDYKLNGKEFQAYVAYQSDSKEKRPGIIVSHAWRGQDEFARKKAEALAEMGYVGFALDMYGKGIESTNDDESARLMKPLFVDRAETRKRCAAALNVLTSHPKVDPGKIGAIGFCFGGMVVLEMAKSGANVNGVVSFHGVIGPRMADMQAKLEPTSKHIKSKILVLHGHDDPLVSQDDIANFQKEMTDAKADWQMHIYGNTMHAFMNPIADNKSQGMLYNELAAKRAWQSMQNFFQEIFK